MGAGVVLEGWCGAGTGAGTGCGTVEVGTTPGTVTVELSGSTEGSLTPLLPALCILLPSTPMTTLLYFWSILGRRLCVQGKYLPACCSVLKVSGNLKWA